MNTTTNTTPLLYDALAEPDRAWLQRTACELRAKLRRTVEEVVSSGRLLAQARRRLGRDQWRPWLKCEAQIPPRSASRLVAVGRVFGKLPDATLRQFTPTALYALAESGVPQSIREFAVIQAQEGQEVTASNVEEWVTLQPDTTPNAPLSLASKDEEPDDTYHDPAEVFAKENWLALCELIGTDGSVHFSATLEAEKDEEDADVTFAGIFIDRDGKRKHAAGGTLEQVLLLLTGGVRKKVCAKCGLNKPLDDFCKRTDVRTHLARENLLVHLLHLRGLRRVGAEFAKGFRS